MSGFLNDTDNHVLLNPNFLLNQGELLGWFKDWEIIHHFEGIKKRPKRAVAQIVCMRPQDQ